MSDEDFEIDSDHMPGPKVIARMKCYTEEALAKRDAKIRRDGRRRASQDIAAYIEGKDWTDPNSWADVVRFIDRLTPRKDTP